MKRIEALQAASQLLDAERRPKINDEVVVTACDEHSSRWIVAFSTRGWIESQDLGALIPPGIGPVVVPKSGAPPWFASTGSPVEDQLEDLS